MSVSTSKVAVETVQFPGEQQSNDFRRRLAAVEPRTLRTYTPTLAVLARSAGAYHWTPEGRKLADFTSGVLVANLGHNPTRWWKRVLDYIDGGSAADAADAEFRRAVPLTAYNAVTPLEVEACERLLANMRAQPGGARMQQVLWAASGSEAIQKALWAALARNPPRDMILATRFGRGAVDLAVSGEWGRMVAIRGSELTDVPLAEAAKGRRVPEDLYRVAEVFFDDEERDGP